MFQGVATGVGWRPLLPESTLQSLFAVSMKKILQNRTAREAIRVIIAALVIYLCWLVWLC